MEEKIEYLEWNAEKYKTFFFPIEKEVTKSDKDGIESVVTRPYKINFTDSPRFMASSLSNAVDNLAEGVSEIKCKDCGCFVLSIKVSRSIW